MGWFITTLMAQMTLLHEIDALLRSFTGQLCFEETQRMKDNTITDFSRVNRLSA